MTKRIRGFLYEPLPAMRKFKLVAAPHRALPSANKNICPRYTGFLPNAFYSVRDFEVKKSSKNSLTDERLPANGKKAVDVTA